MGSILWVALAVTIFWLLVWPFLSPLLLSLYTATRDVIGYWPCTRVLAWYLRPVAWCYEWCVVFREHARWRYAVGASSDTSYDCGCPDEGGSDVRV